MSSIDKDTLRRVRGHLGEENPDRPNRGPGARGLEHMARNRRCKRLAAVTLVGASADAAARRLGVPMRSEEASPFAAARGGKFEDHLFKEDCKRVWQLYLDAKLIPANFLFREDLHTQWLDMEKGPDGHGEFSFEERRRLSEDLLRRRAAGDLTTPTLVLKPRLAVRAGGQEFAIEPDAMIATDDDPFYRVAEIKSYADRRGYTDQGKTGSAARQAAVGVVAVRQFLSAEGLTPDLVPSTADLIFSNSGSDTPTLNRLDISGEVSNIQAALDDADSQLETLLVHLNGRTLDDPAALASIENYLCSSCSTHCPMFEYCRTDAIEQGHPVALGDDASELLSGLGSLHRAIALRDGTDAPANDDEQIVVSLLAEAMTSFHQARDAPEAYAEHAAGTEEDERTGQEGSPLYASDDAEDDERLEIVA